MEVEVLAAFAGLSYGSHTVGFTPPATLSRAAISHYNTPALHVHGGSSHAVAVSHPSTPRSGRSYGDKRAADVNCEKFYACNSLPDGSDSQTDV